MSWKSKRKRISKRWGWGRLILRRGDWPWWLMSLFAYLRIFSFFKVYFIDFYITVFPVFFPLIPSTWHPLPSSNPHSLVHVHGSCIYVLWLLHFLYYCKSPYVYFVLTNYASYSLYLFRHFPPPRSLPADNPPCGLYVCDSVPVLVVCLVCFLFFS